MSCSCPIGFSANTFSNFCERIIISAATYNGTLLSISSTSLNDVFSIGGAVFYEDITTLDLPVYISGKTAIDGNFYTENGTRLFDTLFFRDSSGRILNMDLGGPGSGLTCNQSLTFNASAGCITNNSFGPPFFRNNVWGGYGLLGRLNQAGIKVGGTSSFANGPFNEWIGFTECINIPNTDTYYIGIGADNEYRIKVNGNVVVTSSGTTNPYGSPPVFPNAQKQSGLFRGLQYPTWSVFPYTFNSGFNVIEMENLNINGPRGFAVEIYSGALSAITAVTTTVQLSALTIFSTADKVGQTFDLGTSNGYSCPDGFALVLCDGPPYCVSITQAPCIPIVPTTTTTTTSTTTTTTTTLPPSDYIEVNECEPITLQVMDVSCSIVSIISNGNVTKNMVVTITGGTSPYTTTWSNGTITTGLSPQSITNLPPGTYTATTTDYWGDFVKTVTCSIPTPNCSNVKISIGFELECIGTTGSGLLSFFASNGAQPYTFSGTINNSPSVFTNPLSVNDLDEIEVIAIDNNGCRSGLVKYEVSCPSGSEPSNCTTTNCPNSIVFDFTIIATNNNNLILFESNLSTTANTSVRGSYKISNVDIPNPFLRQSTAPLFERTNYYQGANGSPSVELSNFLEIGFNQLTPPILTNNDSPWVISVIPYSAQGYVPPTPFTPGTTINIDIALYDDDFCVHKGSGSILIPINNSSTTTTIIF